MNEGTAFLDRYTVLGRLGSGAYGVVYQARHERAGTGYSRVVAIKMLRPELVTSTLLERFRDEARLLGRIQHGAVVKCGPPIWLRPETSRAEPALNGMAAFVMDHAHGLPLSRWTERGVPMPLSVALSVVGRVAEILHEVHYQVDEGRPLRIVHRDIKPSNLILGRGGDLRVLDLGVARADTADRDERPGTRGLVGTPGYMPPERLHRDGHDPHDPAGDVYALGVVLHELLTGRMPTQLFRGTLIPVNVDDDLAAGLALAAEMVAPEPERRPAYREIARRCASIQRRMTAVPFVEWCDGEIPAELELPRDTLTGLTLVEASPASAPPAPRSEPVVSAPASDTSPLRHMDGRRWAWPMGGVAFAMVLGLAGVWAAGGWGTDTEGAAVIPSLPDDVRSLVAPAPSPEREPAASTASPVPIPAAAVAAPPAERSTAPSTTHPPEVRPATPPPRPPAPIELAPPAEVPPVAGVEPTVAPAVGGAVWLADATLAGRLRAGGRTFSLPQSDLAAGRYSLELTHEGRSAPALGSDGGPLVVVVEGGSRVELVCSPVSWRCRVR